MESPPEVNLRVALEGDSLLLANLLQLYIHDLSAVFPGIQVGADGRFGYPKLPLYWSEPTRRFPFLIQLGARPAGFVLATRGSPVSEDPEVLDIAEFFVLRGERRASVGRAAARLLWDQLPGRWTVRVSEGNRGALPFWSRVIDEFTNGRAKQSERPGQPNSWRVFSFETAARTPAQSP
jgi:predicted acetyltransferase